MKTAWRILFFLSALTVAYPQGASNGYTSITWDNGSFTPPNPLPSCTGAYQNFSQYASYAWTLWCIDTGGNFTGIRSGSVSGNGTGGCPTAMSACSAPNGSKAPTFNAHASVANPTTYNLWIDMGTNNAVPVMPPFVYTCGTPTASTSPNPPSMTSIPGRCYCNPGDPSCKGSSPIVIDTTGEGFFLTDKAHGVEFRKGPASQLQQMSWTDPAHHNAWLVRPNADGSVTSMSMNMFGNLSPQPNSGNQNGYAALAYLASQEGCGKVAKLDVKSCPSLWGELRLWHDANQDGIAQPEEVGTLDAAGIKGLSLESHESRYIDQYGNQFFFDSKIFGEADHGNTRCYDVWLVL